MKSLRFPRRGFPAAGAGTTPFETSGWYVAATVDYKLDWGSVGAFGWHAAGDDEDGAWKAQRPS